MASAICRSMSSRWSGGQLLAVGRQIVVEPDGVRVEVTEQQGRAVFVFLVVEDGQDAGVIQRLDDLELTSRRPLAAACRSSSDDAWATVYWRTRQKTLSKEACLASRS